MTATAPDGGAGGDRPANGAAASALDEALASSAAFLRWTMAAIAVAYLLSGAFVVGPEEEAVVLAFGRLSGETQESRVRGPGLHFAFPAPFEEVVKFPVRRVREVVINTFAPPADDSQPDGKKDEKEKKSDREKNAPSNDLPDIAAIRGLDPAAEGYLLSADMNIVRASMTVRWKVRDLPKYLFGHREAERVLREQVESAAIAVIGGTGIDDILTDSRETVRAKIAERAQASLDRLNTGIEIVSLEIPLLAPPAFLAEAFNEVNAAKIEAKGLADEANAYRSQNLPAAAAEANRVVKAAEQYRAERLARAKGEARRFESLLARYRADPAVFRARIYAEAVEQILDAVERKTILPPGAKGSTVRLLLDAPSAGAEEPKEQASDRAAGAARPREKRGR
jgi:membrane protease subunit HflK